MKSLLQFTFLSVFILFVLLPARPVLAQIPSNPAESDSTGNPEEHVPGIGFRVVTKKDGTLNFATYLSSRYLNQQGMESSFTDSFGRNFRLQKRNDLQFQKVMLYFKGWLFNPDFRYLLYTWTSNANMGQVAQVVVAGNIQYKVKNYLDLGIGVGGLPTNRTMFGQWPHWYRHDARPMADEFFRGSFTTGIWAQGRIHKNIFYKTMLGNNLSQLGIDGGQLDDGFDTWSSALLWKGVNYGPVASYGDLEHHENLSGMLSVAYTRSDETRQSQPGTEAPENTQIRLSDGTGIFSFNAFNDSSQVLEARYQMASVSAGLKYKGFSLDGDFFYRRISDFKALGALSVSELTDQGYSVQAGAMLIPKTLQLYGIGSYINGEYGNPWEINGGLNWYLLKNRVLRVNSEVIISKNSPVGYLSFPTVVGANGTVFMVNLELFY
ncbi:hypothetical protein [Adhaeribacter terreus]|uniref:Porin n=1 Tax=Adhaeribacter terreus TaxID=529703 RepID=A0ABW0E7S7_9BACT